MLKIDSSQKKLIKLQKSTLAQSDHWENDFRDMIIASPDEFCDELGESLWIIGKEVRPSDAIADRIDILAIDEDGNSVVIELKRGGHKLQLLQAISYAGMVAKWSVDRFVDNLSRNYPATLEEAKSDIEDFIGDLGSINRSQRIMLVAEIFDPAILISAEWLHENFDVDIRCFRVDLSKGIDGADYLTCALVYPPIEIASLTRGTGPRGEAATPVWGDWNAALKDIENKDLITFVTGEISKNQENRLRYRDLMYRIAGKRRYSFSCRKKQAYIWQHGRFIGDEEFWENLISKSQTVKVVDKGRNMRFNLITKEDFDKFKTAVTIDLVEKDFSVAEDFTGPPDDTID